MGLDDRRGHRPSELSGGQQQRVAIARALVSRPTILFADEPTGNLDSRTGEEILTLLRASADEYHQTIVMVTHEPRAAAIADRVLFLADGSDRQGARPHDGGRGARGHEHPGTVTRVALRGLLGPQAARRPHRDGDRARRRHDQRHLRAHRHDQVRLHERLHPGVQSTPTPSSPARARSAATTVAATATALPSLPGSLLARVQRAAPGVAGGRRRSRTRPSWSAATGRSSRTAGRRAWPSATAPAEQRFTPLHLASGNWPGPGQVDIDAATASKQHYARRPAGRRGRARAGAALPGRRHGQVRRRLLAGRRDDGDLPARHRPDAVRQARASTTRSTSARARGCRRRRSSARSRRCSGASAQVRTGQAQAQQATKDTSGFLTIFQDFLLAFGGIALFVGSFVIANTLSITIAQRTRELATLRTLGATQRQVLGSVLLEALVIGILASVVGLFVGLGLAKGLNSLLVLVRHRPAPDEHRVQDAHDRGRTRGRDRRHPAGGAATGAALHPRAADRGRARGIGPAAVALCPLQHPDGDRDRHRGAGWSRDRRPGRPAACRPCSDCSPSASAALRLPGRADDVRAQARAAAGPRCSAGRPRGSAGAAGALARRNAARNPARTASTAAALMIGLALVTLVGVLAAGLRSRLESAIDQLFVADYALTASQQLQPRPASPRRTRCARSPA